MKDKLDEMLARTDDEINKTLSSININDVIDAHKLSLNEWLEVLFSEKFHLLNPHRCFPTDQMRDEYLKNINERSEHEVKSLLRRFLVISGNYGSDDYLKQGLIFQDKQGMRSLDETTKKFEFCRRLFDDYSLTWEGITWVLDLLPYFPNDALKALDSYFLAHCQFLSDDGFSGMVDARTLIIEKFIEVVPPRETLLNLQPEEFEWIVGELYEKMGFSIKFTKSSYDDGVDIVAENSEPGKKDKLVIQCKRYTPNIGCDHVRNLLGVVVDQNAAKGVLVGSSDFTPMAKKKANEHPKIELINFETLTKLLNKYLGTQWQSSMYDIFFKRKLEKMQA